MFQFQPTAIAEWQHLLIEAQQHTGIHLVESVENYLVHALNANVKNNALVSHIIAIDFLENIHIETIHHFQTLRSIGDECLILSGLFPDYTKRRHVSADYYKNLGENAYYVLSSSRRFSQSHYALYYQLFENFSDLIMVLKSTREAPSSNRWRI